MYTSTPLLTRYRVAAIQFEPTLGEKEQNVVDLLHLVEEAAQQEARLIVLPEMATTGYCWESREEIAPYVEAIPGPTTERFQQYAAHYGCYITLSLPEVDPDTDIFYNSLVLLGPQGIVGTYRKIHSYISEPRWARDGDLGMPVWDTPLGRLTGLICQDAAYFEAARVPALHGADVILFPTNWLDEQCPSSSWIARAFENGVYFIAANRYGNERGIQFSGGSCILNPDGSIQAYQDTGKTIIYGEVDLDKSRNKHWHSTEGTLLGDRLADRRPTEYKPLVHNTYLWEPLLYHSLYGKGELPPGQLSGVAVIQTELQQLNHPKPSLDALSSLTYLESLCQMVQTLIHDHYPARPDVLVLPELLLPGFPTDGSSANPPSPEIIAENIRRGAIQVPGPETARLTELANELQISLVLGVAERVATPTPHFYNTILLIDPEGVYGSYRKLHLTKQDQLWATPGDNGLPFFDTPAGRIGLATGYDVLFPETLRVLASKGVDLVCAPTLLNFPMPIGLRPTTIPFAPNIAPDEYDPIHYVIWRERAAENHVYLAMANWSGSSNSIIANGFSGIFAPRTSSYPWAEVIIEDDDPSLAMMTIDTREQRNGQRSSTIALGYSPGHMTGSLTGELAYDIRESIPGNAVRSKPLMRKRLPFWYLDIVRPEIK